MFIYNVKLNSKSIVKVSFIIIALIIVIFFVVSVYKIFNDTFKVKDSVETPEVAYIEDNNYTNILKSVYENLDTYIGQKICFTGYIYRNLDFEDDEFVLARNMTTNTESKTLIVGFLCKQKKAKDFEDGCWVTITGEISKGNYHGDIPILKVIKIEKTEKPENELVPPPDDTYIPTAVIF